MPRSDLIQLRRGTASEWLAVNPVLALGEPGLETDTDFIKYGDGLSAWSALDYAEADTAAIEAEIDALTVTVATKADASALDAKLALAGGTMTGALTLAGLPTQGLHAATKTYVDDTIGSPQWPPVGIYLATDYGMVGDGSTDNTAAFQALLNLVISNNGGYVRVPAGDYIFSTEPFGPANAQITLPYRAATDGCAMLQIVGPAVPTTNGYSISPVPDPSVYAVFHVTAAGSGAAPAFIGDANDNPVPQLWNEIYFIMRNMVIQLPPNPAITALDLFNVGGGMLIEDVLVHCGGMWYGQPEPTHVQFALRAPGISKAAYTCVNRFSVRGCATALQAGEITCGNFVAMGCRYALGFSGANHTASFDFIGAYGCRTAIHGSASCPLFIQTLEIEQGGADAWQLTGYDVEDPINALTGLVHWVRFDASFGSDPIFTKQAGFNLVCQSLRGAGQIILDDVPTILTNAAEGSHFYVTLDGNRTLGTPTSPHYGQSITWEFSQGAGGNHTLTLDSGFRYGTDIPSITLSTVAGTRDILTAIFDRFTQAWFVTDFKKGYS